MEGAAEVRAAFHRIVENARAYAPEARIVGVQVQQLLPPGQGGPRRGVTDPTFGKVVSFGLGEVLVEVLKDVTFRLAPVTADEGTSMLDSMRGVTTAPTPWQAVPPWRRAAQPCCRTSPAGPGVRGIAANPQPISREVA